MPQIILREIRCPVPFSRLGSYFLTVLSKIRCEDGAAPCTARPKVAGEVLACGLCAAVAHLREVTAPLRRGPRESGSGALCGGTVLVRGRSGREALVCCTALDGREAT